jgi:hypothetical protein
LSKQKLANRVGISAFQISAFCFSNQPPRNAVKPERRLAAGFGRSRDLHTPRTSKAGCQPALRGQCQVAPLTALTIIFDLSKFGPLS